MSKNDERIKDLARGQVEKAVGQTVGTIQVEQPLTALLNFVTRTNNNSQELKPPLPEPAPFVKSTIYDPGPIPPAPCEAPGSPVTTPDTDGSPPGTKELIVIDNGTPNFYNFSADFVGPV